MGVTYQDCAQPQIWMAGVIVDTDPSLDKSDRSFPAFWLPFQDVTSHNHSPQWVQQIQGEMTDGGVPDGGTSSTSGTSSSGGPDSGPTCGEADAPCGGSSPLCCTDMVCCVTTCQPVCAQ
jgi:hypothetical protein